jgi:FkbM family methyltransferase
VSVLSFIVRAVDRLRRQLAPDRTDSLTVASVLKDILNGERFVAVDVGAANGILPHWHLLDGAAQLYQIEPREEACRELQQENQAAGLSDSRRVIQAAVAGTEGERILHVSNVPTGTSLLPHDPEASLDCVDYVDSGYLFPITERIIETRRLSSIMIDAKEHRAELVKLDIQGAELEALQGLGGDRLRTLLGAELEIGMHSFYPREARFPAIHQFMEDRGLELFDMRVARVRRPWRGSHGAYESEVFLVDENTPTVAARLWEIDAIYFRKKSLILSEGDAGTVRRMVVAYAVYNFYSEAHALIGKAERAGILTEGEAQKLEQSIVDLHHVACYRPWLADSPFWRAVRRFGARFAPRNSPRWCQHMYQAYPNG